MAKYQGGMRFFVDKGVKVEPIEKRLIAIDDVVSVDIVGDDGSTLVVNFEVAVRGKGKTGMPIIDKGIVDKIKKVAGLPLLVPPYLRVIEK